MLAVECGDLAVPPEVAILIEGDVVARAFDDEHARDGAASAVQRERIVHGRLQRRHASLAPSAIGRDHEARLSVVDASAQTFSAEASEDHRVRCAEARDREHRDHRLRDHRHVDGHAVARGDAEAGEHVRGALHLVRELGVREGACVAGFALEVERDAVAVARCHVAIEAVRRDVQLAVLEPLRERRVRPVEHLAERLRPLQVLGLLRPVPLGILRGLPVDGRVGDVGLLAELRTRSIRLRCCSLGEVVAFNTAGLIAH